MQFSPLLTSALADTAFAASNNAADPDTVNAWHPRQPAGTSSSFTRMFADLPAFAVQTDAVRKVLIEIGAVGGLLDARDVLSDPVQSILNQPQFSPNNFDNPSMTAGVTFFGQFLDHDISLDRRSQLMANADPSQTRNFRTAAFDWDSVYGEGPDRSPELDETGSGFIKFKVEQIPGAQAVSRRNAPRFDLPRDGSGEAAIGDSRNDEHVIISQFHLAMLQFHNAVTDDLGARQRGTPARVIFTACRTCAARHECEYTTVVLHS